MANDAADMFGLLKKVTDPPSALLLKHLYGLESDEPIQRPELEIRGWLAFDRAFDLSKLSLTLETDTFSLPVVLESRPDVAADLPNEFCTGFNTFFDIQEDLISKNPDWVNSARLRILWPNGDEQIPLDARLAEKLLDENSYFRTNHVPKPNHAVNAAQLKDWDDSGFLVLEGFYSAAEADELKELIESSWTDRANYSDKVTIDRDIGTEDERRISFADADLAIRKTPHKLNDLYLESDRLREYQLGDRLRDVLSPMMGGTPMICNSLCFEYGSQQSDHFDTYFMPPLTRNRMVASWIAMEDVQLDAGPVRYYPGSHKILPYRFSHGRYNLKLDERPQCDEYVEHQLKERGLDPVLFSAKKGDVLIWHAHLLHGGTPINNPGLTRKSLVTHYFCCEDWDDACYEKDRLGIFYLKRD